ncbi:MAG: hypothetical protein CME70_09365 [Halobacteriovorax sp.]|nr:hypothetical protein [Halobacteriovorax sp.]|tara:strand:- start:196203 stop:197327 length:1125 start_codon:yes stop_codon:yes gene_type:complete
MEEGDRAAYIEKIAEELGTVFQKHELGEALEDPGFLSDRGQWLFLSWPLCQESQKLINDLKIGFYLLYDGSQEHEPEFLRFLESDRNLISPIDTTRDHRFHIPLLRNASPSSQDENRKELLGVGENLNKMIEFSMAELQRVKRLHEQVVPMKNDNFKGVKILSKFAAGEGAGGEFFDIVKGEQEVLLLLTNTTSYVASSIILSHFEKLRAYSEFGEKRLTDFILGLSGELKDLGLLDMNDTEALQLLVVKIDLNKMKFKGFQFGKTELISSKGHVLGTNDFPLNKEFLSQSEFGFDLERGERLVISSPGVRKNCGGFMDEKKYEDFVRERLPLGARDLLNEVYFQLKKKRDSDFLKFDASVIYIEVDKNVIVEV